MKKTSGSRAILEGLKKKKAMAEYGSRSNPKGGQSPTSIYNKLRLKKSGDMSPKSEGGMSPQSNAIKSASIMKVTTHRPKPVTTDKISKHTQRVK